MGEHCEYSRIEINLHIFLLCPYLDMFNLIASHVARTGMAQHLPSDW